MPIHEKSPFSARPHYRLPRPAARQHAIGVVGFYSPSLANSQLCYAITRRDDINRNQYVLTYAHYHGMAYTHELTTLNHTTADATTSDPSSGHPLIWFDPEFDREYAPRSGLLDAMLASHSQKPVIRLTGRKRFIPAKNGGEREVQEVEILLSEDELSHVCCYCGSPEFIEPRRFERCGGTDASLVYWCPTCSTKSALGRNFTWMKRRYFGAQ